MFSLLKMPNRRTFGHFLTSSEDNLFFVKKEDMSSKKRTYGILHHVFGSSKRHLNNFLSKSNVRARSNESDKLFPSAISKTRHLRRNMPSLSDYIALDHSSKSHSKLSISFM